MCLLVLFDQLIQENHDKLLIPVFQRSTGEQVSELGQAHPTKSKSLSLGSSNNFL